MLASICRHKGFPAITFVLDDQSLILKLHFSNQEAPMCKISFCIFCTLRAFDNVFSMTPLEKSLLEKFIAYLT